MMKKAGIYYWVLGLFALLGANSCNSNQEGPEIGFYYWKTVWKSESKAAEYLQKTAETPLYLRFFDIDRPAEQDSARLRGVLQAASPMPANFVPTVFITNRTFIDPPVVQEAYLPTKTYQMLRDKGWNGRGEVQFDCDWSGETKRHFFSFLDGFRKIAGDSVQLSATIRLHQIKFPDKTGVPPVDRGTLMFYNMGDLKNPETLNSILDLEAAKTYLKPLPDYPLPLDLALPVFSWAVLRRWEKVVNLLPEVTEEDFLADSLLEIIGEGRVKVKESHYFSGVYVYAQDELRLETISPESLKEAAQLIAAHLQPAGFRYVLFYHLSETTAQNFPFHELEEIRTLLR